MSDKTGVQQKAAAVVDRLLADMEKDLPPWRQPWSQAGKGLPVSGATQRPYRGFNTFVLWAQAMGHGWTDNRFFTFSQIQKLKAKVKKGEAGTEVFLWKPAWCLPVPVNGKKWLYEEAALPKPLPQGTERRLLLRSFYVWNGCQCDGLPKVEVPSTATTDTSATAEALLTELGSVIPVRFGGIMARATYSPARDEITSPERSSYESTASYYSTLFHEFGHGSGHKSRLDRDQTGGFGSLPYAIEELVAESASAIVTATLGLPYSTQHASYLKSWAQKLRELSDAERQRTVMSALQRGQKAADWVLSGGTLVCAGDDSVKEGTGEALQPEPEAA